MLRIVASEQTEQDALKLDLDGLVREGARRMLLAALRAEVDEYVAQHADHRDEVGHALVVRNGVAEPRTVTTAAGELEIQAPRVHDRRKGRRFTSAILPPWARRSPKVTEVLPVLYLRGISTKDFEPALAEFFGSEAGLSASTIQRLTREWSQELAVFQRRDLSQVDYVYLWADGVHFNIRLEHERLCCLVLIGVRADGHKELVAVGDGYRESTESWSELLRDLKRRGMRAPLLAIGDGALGFWGALREVFPQSREQRCWVHCALRRYPANTGSAGLAANRSGVLRGLPGFSPDGPGLGRRRRSCRRAVDVDGDPRASSWARPRPASTSRAPAWVCTEYRAASSPNNRSPRRRA
jgi:transposase-like protein